MIITRFFNDLLLLFYLKVEKGKYMSQLLHVKWMKTNHVTISAKNFADLERVENFEKSKPNFDSK